MAKLMNVQLITWRCHKQIDDWDAVWLVATNALQAQWVEFIGSAQSA